MSGKKRSQKFSFEKLTPEQWPEWDTMVSASDQDNLFQKSVWFSNYPEENYEVIAVQRGGRMVGGLLLETRPNGLFLSKVRGPIMQLTQADQQQSRAKTYEETKAFLSAAAEYISENRDFYNQRWHPSLDNWLPFYWAGYQQTTHYTYMLDTSHTTDQLWDGFQTKIRGDIRKSKQADLRLREGTPEEYLPMLEAYKKHYEVFQEEVHGRYQTILNNLHGTPHMKIYHAYSASDELLAGIVMLYNNRESYYWNAAHVLGQPATGAQSALIWHALENLPDTVKQFNFLGSMVEGTEKYFRGFGGEMVPISRVWLPEQKKERPTSPKENRLIAWSKKIRKS